MKSTLVVFCVLICAASAEAKKNKDRGNGGYGQFGPADRTMIHDYYRDRPSGLPPGLAKRNGDLPPGLQKQLRRNGRLPPGLEKKLRPFPDDLERRLPPLRPGLRRGYYDDRAFIYDPRSMAIQDVFMMFR